MKYFKLSCLVGLIFNCGKTQEFKIQVFFYVNSHGQTLAFPKVESKASRDISRNEI